MPKTILFLSIILLLTSCNRSKNRVDKSSWTGTLTCDAENIDESWTISNNKNIHLRGKFIADSNIYLSGKTSLQINSKQWQAFYFEIIGVNFLDKIKAKVWRYKNGNKSTLSIAEKTSFFQHSIPTGRTKGKWEELEVTYSCYSNKANDTILIQCLFLGSPTDTAWFDDFSCEVESFNPSTYTRKKDDEFLNINLPKSSEKQLTQKRIEALKKGILIKEKGDLVNATLNGNKKIKLRLKGDWTDHLMGNKWLFRIETKDKWKNMSKFSIQSPITRHMMNEWVFHKMLLSEQVLTTPYFFSPVKVNSNEIGIMAIEEHFTQDLLKNLNKPLGPILKFNEDYLWNLRVKNIPIHEYPVIESAEIEAFSRKHFNSTPELTATMNKGRWLLYAHQQNLLPLDSLFDIDAMAKYMAISDLIGASHSNIWHNTRYYYNIIKNRLEPIGFDGVPTLMPNGYDTQILNSLNETTFSEKRILNLMSSSLLREKFIKYLYKFSSKSYLDQFFQSTKTEYQSAEKILQQEYNNYQFRKIELYYRAKQIQEKLKNHSKKSEDEIISKLNYNPNYYPTPSTIPYPGLSVIAYQSEKMGDTTILKIVNFHHEKIKIQSSIEKDLKKTALNPNNSSNLPEVKTIRFLGKTKFIKFSCPSSNKIYKIKVSKYNLPKNY